MFALALTLSTLSLLVLAAHYLREGNMLVTLALIVVAGMLLFRRRRWVVRVVQAVLGLGAIVWGVTLSESAQARVAEGGDPRRLVVILGSVIAVNVLAALLLGTKTVIGRYGSGAPEAPPPA
jgi:hypothetical protein